MSKYDFGYDIEAGSTMEWAFSIIKNNSEILELGPAIGTLTKHLKEEKNCSIDIVEIDEESGKKAAHYARQYFIEPERGDIESFCWYEKLKEQRYDYIVLLDVLEHLKKAEMVLRCLRELLKDNGMILLSVPNIAHNSIIINLFNNKFQYTEVGLLDSTHVHFYTHDSLCDLLHKVNLFPIKKEAIQLRVGENEIENTYSDVAPSVEALLRTRQYADVYQFLFCVKKEKEEEKPLQVENLAYTLYKCDILDENNALLKTEFFNPKKGLKMEFNIDSTERIVRLNPLNGFCILSKIDIKGYIKGETIDLDIVKTNAAHVHDKYIFMDNDPQLFFKKVSGVERVFIECEFVSYGIDDTRFFYEMWKDYLSQKAALEDYKHTQEQLYEYIAKKEDYVQELLKTCQSYQEKIEQLQG